MKNPAGAEPSVESFGYKQELKRSLSLSDLLVYGLVFIVPIAPLPVFASSTTRARAWCRSST